jgi:hypothetical protein
MGMYMHGKEKGEKLEKKKGDGCGCGCGRGGPKMKKAVKDAFKTMKTPNASMVQIKKDY